MNEVEQPLISVVMNCYNCERYLRESIESVMKQTYSNWEIIFWDNQSTDSSAEIVLSYQNNRIKYFRSEVHTELGQARNSAVERAVGKWIAFLDCDDLWLPWKLSGQVALIDDEIGMIYSGAKNSNNPLQTYICMPEPIPNQDKQLPIGNIFSKLCIYNFIYMSSLMVRADIYRELGGVNDRFTYAEDYDLVMRIASRYQAAALQDTALIYRIHNESVTSKIGIKGKFESIQILLKYSWSYSAWFGIVRRSMKIIMGR